MDLPVLNSKRVLLELALYLEGSGDAIEDLLQRNQLTPEDLQTLLLNPVFKMDLGKMREEVRDHGLTFKIKARTMAEELLKTTWDLTQDAMTSSTVKADLIKSVVEWGGLRPKTATETAGTGGGVKILINLGGNSGREITIPAVPAEIE